MMVPSLPTSDDVMLRSILRTSASILMILSPSQSTISSHDVPATEMLSAIQARATALSRMTSSPASSNQIQTISPRAQGNGAYFSETCNSMWTTPQRLDDLMACSNIASAFINIVDRKVRVPECSVSSSSWVSRYNTVWMASMFEQFLETDTIVEPLFGPPITSYAPQIGSFSGITTELTFLSNPTTSNPCYCCGDCYIHWGDVKVLFWPVENASTDCLSLYGFHAHEWNKILARVELAKFAKKGQGGQSRSSPVRIVSMETLQATVEHPEAATVSASVSWLNISDHLPSVSTFNEDLSSVCRNATRIIAIGVDGFYIVG